MRTNPVASTLPRALMLICVLLLGLCLSSCGEKKQKQPPAQKQTAEAYDLAGEWHSDIEGADRLISKSIYRIAQEDDTVSIRLVSTKSPEDTELVPDGMWFRAAGTWQNGALRLAATSWISGRDTCAFQMRGDMDKLGQSLLLHFPGDLCGETNLPYTRKLYRPE